MAFPVLTAYSLWCHSALSASPHPPPPVHDFKSDQQICILNWEANTCPLAPYLKRGQAHPDPLHHLPDPFLMRSFSPWPGGQSFPRDHLRLCHFPFLLAANSATSGLLPWNLKSGGKAISQCIAEQYLTWVVKVTPSLGAKTAKISDYYSFWRSCTQALGLGRKDCHGSLTGTLIILQHT